MFPYVSPQLETIGIESAEFIANSIDPVSGNTEDYLNNNEQWW